MPRDHHVFTAEQALSTARLHCLMAGPELLLHMGSSCAQWSQIAPPNGPVPALKGEDVNGIDRGLRVYIAGKITDDPNYKPKFRAAQAEWAAAGFDAVAPLDNGLPEDAEYEDQMSACFALLATCDAVVLLPDWIDSPGAKRELIRAHELRMRVLFHEDGVL